jgi:asparagine synthase (glutamine-hydrolysing)
MCGIFGFYLADSKGRLTGDVLQSMGDAIRHRGPDDEGFLLDGPFGFGMRRLSIIDLKTGRQPVQNEDGSVQLVFNGEIYNYRELTRDLLERGHSFYTNSDTEVIVHLFEEYGVECVQHLRGMFAFALWDAKNRTLVLARDRVGIKPLYYAETASGLIFASEIKAILRFPRFERQIDRKGLLAYLQYGYVPDPLSIFQGVAKLSPGHVLVVRNGRPIESRRYWDSGRFFESPSDRRPERELMQELRWRLAEVVRLHLVSDVPLGAFLSGGIDSSSVVGFMATELGQSVKTFSIGFKEEGFSELPYARLVSQRFATEHHELIVEPTSVDLIARIVEYFDEPFADPSAIPTYLVARLAGKHVKVVLSGDGGDEIFAGYDRYVVDYRRRRYDVLSRLKVAGLLRRVSEALPDGALGRNYLFNMSLPRMERYIDSISHYPVHRMGELVSAELLAELYRERSNVFAPHVAEGRLLDFPARLQYLDLKTYLPGDILTKVDRMSMAHSIEARVPLLDHELVEFVAAIPSRYKLQGSETKHLFKRAIQGVVPSEVLSRRKQGFAVPLDCWFRDGFQDYLREGLLGHGSLEHGLFNRSYIEVLWTRWSRTARPEDLYRLWTLLAFEMWYRAFIPAR